MSYNVNWCQIGFEPDIEDSTFETYEEAVRFLLEEIEWHEADREVPSSEYSSVRTRLKYAINGSVHTFVLGDYIYWLAPDEWSVDEFLENFDIG